MSHYTCSSLSTALPHKKCEVNETVPLDNINSSITANNNTNNNNNNNCSVGRENVALSLIKANEKINTNGNSNKINHYTLHSPHQTVASNMNTIAASASSGVGRKVSRTNNVNNNINSVVAHPRAVKPGVSKGKSRGPRSQSGKNVSPSNHSVFS